MCAFVYFFHFNLNSISLSSFCWGTLYCVCTEKQRPIWSDSCSTPGCLHFCGWRIANHHHVAEHTISCFVFLCLPETLFTWLLLRLLISHLFLLDHVDGLLHICSLVEIFCWKKKAFWLKVWWYCGRCLETINRQPQYSVEAAENNKVFDGYDKWSKKIMKEKLMLWQIKGKKG